VEKPDLSKSAQLVAKRRKGCHSHHTNSAGSISYMDYIALLSAESLHNRAMPLPSVIWWWVKKKDEDRPA